MDRLGRAGAIERRRVEREREGRSTRLLDSVPVSILTRCRVGRYSRGSSRLETSSTGRSRVGSLQRRTGRHVGTRGSNRVVKGIEVYLEVSRYCRRFLESEAAFLRWEVKIKF
jgi:hypothetical protein